MLPNFLFPETQVNKNGEGAPVPLGQSAGKLLQLTLGITGVVEQESLDVDIHGSADGQEWGKKPLATFPQKFYEGISTVLLDLSKTPDIQHLRAQWKVNKWGRGEPTPMFKFYVFAEPAAAVVGNS